MYLLFVIYNIYPSKEINFKEVPMHLWALASLKLVEQVSSLETQTGAMAALLNTFSRKPQVLFLWLQLIGRGPLAILREISFT